MMGEPTRGAAEAIVKRYERAFGAEEGARVRLGGKLRLRLRYKGQDKCVVLVPRGEGEAPVRLLVGVKDHVLNAATACGWQVELDPANGWWTRWDKEAPCVVEQ